MGQAAASHKPLTYRRLGEGPWLVGLHGFGEDGRIWDNILHELSETAEVIVPTLPGCDGQEWTYLHDEYLSLEYMADQLLETLTDAKIHACTLLGHSMGGYLSLAFAERHPERIHGLVLLHSTAMPDSESKRTQRVRSIRFMETYGAAAFLRETIPALYAPAFAAAHPSIIQKHLQHALEWASPAVLIAHYRAMMDRPDRQQYLQDSRWAAGFLAGALDKAVPLEEILPQIAGLPTAQKAIWADIAHMGMKECPKQLVAFLTSFLSDR
ncbi:MAG: alpha/beta fold hydrolase [Bacteroidetes bacterium]|nr:alpha/beta fold hydrolase [Bacteroidota bacterium]